MSDKLIIVNKINAKSGTCNKIYSPAVFYFQLIEKQKSDIEAKRQIIFVIPVLDFHNPRIVQKTIDETPQENPI